MELTPIQYKEMHEIVLTLLQGSNLNTAKDKDTLFVIGKWYNNWLSSQEPELALKVPFYTKKLVTIVIPYLYWLDVLIALIKIPRVKSLEGQTLFNIKRYLSNDSYYRKNAELGIDYLRSYHNTHYFDQETKVSSDRFLPLFSKEQIGLRGDHIARLFQLFEIIGRLNLIPYAIKLDLDKDLTLLIKESSKGLHEKMFIWDLYTDDFRYNHDLRDRKLDDLIDIDIRRCISITYPYHINIDSSVINEFRNRSKIFRLQLSSRFCHEEIENDQVILTNAEIGIGTELDIIDVINAFTIIETSCRRDLILLLRELRSDWNFANLNAFTTPFPAKWLMCIHQGRDLDFWFTQFKKDYSELPLKLTTDSLELIKLVYEINWIDNFLKRDAAGSLVLPKSIIFREIFNSLKEYLINDFKNIVYVDEIIQLMDKSTRVYLFDPFNIILLNNIHSEGNLSKLKIVVPDFIYYTYQPFVRNKALRYHIDALYGGLRNALDGEYIHTIEKWNQLSEEMVQSARKELKAFNKSKSIVEENFELSDEFDVPLEPTQPEILERIALKERRIHENTPSSIIEITTSDNKRITLRPFAPILIKVEGVLIRTIAKILDVGSFFIPIDEVFKNMDLNGTIDRLLTLSNDTVHWHQNLNVLNQKEPGLFENLKSNGLSISKSTFEKDYLGGDCSATDFHLPRAKQDWNIVCDRLGISDRQTAWNAIKCRENLNQLKSTYRNILELMVDTSSFAINISDSVLDQITDMLSLLPHSDSNEKKEAIELVREIGSMINLQRVETIENHLL